MLKRLSLPLHVLLESLKSDTGAQGAYLMIMCTWRELLLKRDEVRILINIVVDLQFEVL